MGFSYANNIEKTGLYLLSLLKGDGRVRYSRFYDGEDRTQEALLRGMGYGSALDGEAEDDYVPECPEHLMDLAAAELERGGIVKTTDLEDLLADESQDYLIELTEKGRAFVESGDRFHFWDAE